MSDSPKMFLGEPDALSTLIRGLALRAEIYVDGDFCGAWAIDSSDKGKMSFHIVGGGEAWLHMEKGLKRLGPGDLVMFPRGQRQLLSHSAEEPDPSVINCPPPWSEELPMTNMICGYLAFDSPLVWPLLDTLDSAIVLDMSSRSSTPHIKSYIELILRELNQRSPGYHTVVNQLALMLFVEVLRQQIKGKQVQKGVLAAIFDTRLSKALAAIHNWPEKNWSLETLAEQAAMSRSSFAKKFHETTGSPAMTYLTNWRMQNARSLLLDTEISVSEVAERCGYESDAAFRKMFKKVMGLTPGEVRRKEKHKN